MSFQVTITVDAEDRVNVKMTTTTATTPATITDDNDINKWLKIGNIEKLEQAVLNGYGGQLRGKTSRIPKINNFLKRVPYFQAKIDAIHMAVAQGKLREVQSLMDRKKLAMCRTQTGASPLHTAVLHKQAAIVKYIVERFPSAIQARDNQGRTPLHYAAVVNDEGNMYRLLIEHGADPKATDARGKIPEYYMENPEELPLKSLREKVTATKVSNRHDRAAFAMANLTTAPSKVEIRQLIQKEDVPRLERVVLSGFGDQLLGETSVNGRVREFLDLVPEFMIKVAMLHAAVVDGSIREVRNLLDRRTMSVTRDIYGANILHKAVVHNHHNIVKYIVENYPECINAKDHDGRTPLHYSMAAEDERIYKTLVGAGADETITDNNGKLPAFYKDNVDQLAIEQVIERDNQLALKAKEASNDFTNNGVNDRQGFKKKIPPNIPMTIHNIRQWIRSGDLNRLEKIVLEGHGLRLVGETALDSRTRSFLKQVPTFMAKIEMLHEAVATGNLREVRSLLDRKKLSLAKDSSGLGLLHKALLYGHTNIARYFCEKYPESLTVKDYEGRTPLHYAAVMKDDGNAYNLLRDAGADSLVTDSKGNTAIYYKENPEELDLLEIQNRTDRIRSKLQATKKNSVNRYRSDTGFNVTRANIRKWIHAEDIEKLNQIVLEGHGDKLLVETTNNIKVKEFLKTVPKLIAQIREVHQAVQDGNVKELEEKIENKQLLLSKDVGGITPLHRAVIMSNRTMSEFIVQQLPDTIKAKDEEGRTPLHYAAALPRDDGFIYNMLIEAGADPKQTDERGKTAEYYQKHPLEAELRVQLARLSRKPQEVNNNTVQTTSRRQVPPALRIPKKVIPVGQLSPEHVTKLINQGDVDKLEQMVLEGHGKKLYGKTSWIEEVRMFLKKVPSYMDRIYAVHTAVANGDLRAVEQLMDNKKLVVAKDDKGLTPLHRAVKHGKADIVRFMLEMNPTAVNVKDNEGRTPMHYAGMYKDRDDIYRILQNFSADATLVDQKGKTPEYYQQSKVKLEVKTPTATAVPVQNEENANEGTEEQEGEDEEALVQKWIDEGDIPRLEQLIIEGKGDVLLGKSSEQDNIKHFLEAVPAFMGKIRAIHNAAADGDLRELQTLLDKKSFAVARDHFSACPLHRALLNGNTDIVRYLSYNYPASLNIQDKDGRTPLHYAAVISDGGLYFRLLHNYGADPNVKDVNGNTPGQYLRGKAVDFTYESLLKRYEEKKVPPRPPSVQRWERPPTEEILKALTPSPPPGERDDEGPLPAPLMEQEEGNSETADVKEETEETPPESEAMEESENAEKDLEIEDSKSRNSETEETKKEGNEDTDNVNKANEESSPEQKTEASADVEAKPEDAESKAEDAESKTEDAESKTEGAESKTEGAESKTEDAESKTEDAESKTEDTESKTEDAESKTEDAESKTEDAESKTEDVESKTEDVESKTEDTESKSEDAESKSKEEKQDETTDEKGKDNEEQGGEETADEQNTNEPSEEVQNNDKAEDNKEVEETENNEKKDEAENEVKAEEGENNAKDKDKEDGGENNANEETKEEGNKENEEAPETAGDENEGGDNVCEDKNENEEEKATQTDSSSRTGSNTVQSTRNNSRLSSRSENPIMWTKEGEYLASVMGDALIKALTDVSQKRPVDPIAYLAMWLYRYALSSETRQNTPNLDNVDENDPLMNSTGINKEEMEKGLYEARLAKSSGHRSSQDGDVQASFEDIAKMKDDNGQTLIHFAANKPHEKNAFWQLIFHSNVSLAERDINYKTARDIAEEAEMTDNVEVIDKNVLELVGQGRMKKIQDLISNSYDHLLDIRSESDTSIIEYAEQQAQMETAELLKGADEFQKKLEVLHTAIRKGDVNEVTEAIDPSLAIARNRHSRSSLHIAVLRGNDDVIEYIVNNFPETIYVRDNLNRTPLHYAMGLENSQALAKILVQAGASRRSKDVKYRTPSYYFVNKEDIIQLKNDEMKIEV